MSRNFTVKLGNTIATLRKNLGYSQQEVANMLGLHRPSISQIEHGEREISAEELSKLGEFFGLSTDGILEITKGPMSPKQKKTTTEDIRITFFRHGEAIDDIYDQYGGWADPEMTPKGMSQAYSIAEKLKLKNLDFDLIYTSPLKRARQVAEIISRELKVNVKVLQYLKERNTYGLLCGINKSVAKKKFPQLVEAYENGKFVLGSERYEDFVIRLPLIFKYIKRSGLNNVCCITHGKVLSGILKELLNLKPSKLEDGCMLVMGFDDNKPYVIQTEGIIFEK